MEWGVLSVAEEGRVAEDALAVIGAGLVEAVHVELPDERVHFVVAEVAGQYDLLELVDVLDHELRPIARPKNYLPELLLLPHSIGTCRISKVLAMKPATSVCYRS